MAIAIDNPAEARRQALQAAIDATKSAAERNRRGQFATPCELAIDIARYVDALIDDQCSRICFGDPSIGTGSFFSAALTVFGTERLQAAIGIELDPAFCDAARNLWSKAGLQIVQNDFTRFVTTDLAQSVAPDLILANPPYVRHHHLSPDDKERLQQLARKMTGIDVNGLAGLYVYFLLLATAWMRDGGYAAWLIPSEFMDVNYGAALKRFLSNQVTLLRVHRFDPTEVQFDDALVSSAVIVFRKSPPPPTHEVEFTFGGTIASPNATDRVRLERVRTARKWTAFPTDSTNDRRTLGEHNGPVLRDFFRIQRGIATGSNKFFVLAREDAKRRGIPDRFLRPILPSPRRLQTTVIDTAVDGYPLIEPQLCVIDCDLAEHVVEDRFPKLWAYLQTAEKLGIMDGYLVGKRSPWYKQEQREPAPFLCTYMGRGTGEKQPLRFIYNRSNAIGTNLYLMLYPRTNLASLLRSNPEHAVEVYHLLGQVTGHELRGEGRVYGGGLNKIEPSELGRISATAIVDRWPDLHSGVIRAETAGLFEP